MCLNMYIKYIYKIINIYVFIDIYTYNIYMHVNCIVNFFKLFID